MFGKTLISLPIAVLAVVVLAGTIAAQAAPPPPYAGMKNPFAWDDAAAQSAGKNIYQQSCLGCHGASGGNIAASKFSDASFGNRLEASPDIDFWILSEGKTAEGMPPFKSAISEQQRWQVLTYIRSLSATPAAAPAPGTVKAGVLSLAIPDTGKSGQEMTLTATLRDEQGAPVSGETVQFFVSVDFFANGDMEIGQSTTDGNGVASLAYIPRFSGDTQFLARHGASEAIGTIALSDAGQRFYQPEAGIKLPTAGPKIFIGPESATHIGPMGQAPTSALYLPGGLVSWLLLVVAAIVMVWSSYFRVIRQIAGIPMKSDIRDTDTRLVPRLALVYVVTLGTLLALKLVIGPYTHFNLLH